MRCCSVSSVVEPVVSTGFNPVYGDTGRKVKYRQLNGNYKYGRLVEWYDGTRVACVRFETGPPDFFNYRDLSWA